MRINSDTYCPLFAPFWKTGWKRCFAQKFNSVPKKFLSQRKHLNCCMLAQIFQKISFQDRPSCFLMNLVN